MGRYREAIDHVHTGAQYHRIFMSSKRDVAVRDRFQRMALGLLGNGDEILDFGAGTGIDAKAYAARGHRTFVYEPADSMREYLEIHCRDEIAGGRVIALEARLGCKVQAVTANFAVLNHFADHVALFEQLAGVVGEGGFVLASMLNPYYLGDARYGWWRRNLLALVRHGRYTFDTASGVHRFAPGVVARAAAPHFRLERMAPRGLGMVASLYMFLLFRRV
ncbi:methyltransferase domain-containing protein [Dyella sp. 2RAB6]|uniref:methyltransferase domain-containing protein n=1 Tax=Dyella sp. 2RAB6 TaxID=3232992 RepID=UPI003F91C321